MSFYFINIHSKLFSYIAFCMYPLQKNPSLCWNEWTLVWLSWVHYRMKSDPTFPQFNNMFSFFTLHFLRWVLRFWYSAFRALAAAVCKKKKHSDFSVFNHRCVCFRPAWEMMKAGAVFHSFCWVEVLLCLEAEGNVTDLLSLHLSASFWNLQPSGPLSILPIISVRLLLRLKPEAEMEIQNSEEELCSFL